MTQSPASRLAYLVFAAWAALALPAVLGAAFRTAPGEPSLGLALHLASVSAAFLVLVVAWPGLGRSVRALDPVLLTSLQSWRILGMMFLFLMVLGDLPAVFAIPAGVGDVLVGVAAPFVAIRMRRGSLSRRGFGWFTAMGLLDFVVAFAAGNYVNLNLASDSGFASMTALPLVLVPGFFVPAFALIHLAGWISFRPDTASPDSAAARNKPAYASTP